MVLDQGVGELVLLGVGVFDIADRVRDLLDRGRDAFIALAADADGPLHRGVVADLRLPLGRDLGEIVGEDEGRARAVRAIDRVDVGVGQLQVAVQRNDLGVVPLLDLAHVDAGENVARELELARLDTGDVHGRNDAAHHGRELDEAVLGQVLTLERGVGGAEGDRLRLDLADAAARADRLVVEAGAGRLLIGFGPLRIDREGEGRAGAGDVGGLGGTGDPGGHGRENENLAHVRCPHLVAVCSAPSEHPLYDSRMTIRHENRHNARKLSSSVKDQPAPRAAPKRGRMALKAAPCPGLLSIISRPRCRSTMCLTMASPSPVPPASRLAAVSTR